MFTDIIFAEGNEAQFLESGKLLKSNLVLTSIDIVNKNSVPDKLQNTRKSCFLMTKQNQNPKGYDLVIADPSFIGIKNVRVLFGFETQVERDKLRERQSGMNHVLCAEAKRTGKILAFNFNSILNANDKSTIFGRMRQNASLIRKYKNDFIIASFAEDPYDLRSGRDYIGFLQELGFSSPEAKQAVGLLSETLKIKT